MTKRVGAREHAIGLLLCAGYVAVLLATSSPLAMSRDESFYVDAANQYGQWLVELANDPGRALERDAIDRRFHHNAEHPPLFKLLFAASAIADQRHDLFPYRSMAYRFPGMLSAGLLLWLTFAFGTRVFGWRAGLFAALALAMIPRVFYHAHLDAFDVPITLMVALVVYCYHRALEPSRLWALIAGVAFGLALATKHNSWTLPAILLVHWTWLAIGRRRRRLQPELPGDAHARPPSWLWLPSMLVLGPIVFVALWPWLWHDTMERLGAYAAFHLRHDYYNMAYFGVNYFRPPFPVSYPFVMTLYTVPLTTLVLAIGALVRRARALAPPRLAVRFWPSGRLRPDSLFTDVLLFGCALAPLVIIALPSTPIFGGTKHWFPAYPFLAMYAGHGACRVATALASVANPKRLRALAVPAAFALLLAPALVETAHSHRFGLSHYGYAAGGVPGAADRGMNRQFWGFMTGEVAPFLRQAMPEGGVVYVCDTTFGAWAMMQTDGLLPPSIRPTMDFAQADYILVHHEHHFAEVDFQAWVVTGSARPVHVLTYDGVPIVSVYRNPRGPRPSTGSGVGPPGAPRPATPPPPR